MEKIHLFAKVGNILGVQQELDNLVDINIECFEGTPLMVALASPDASMDMIHFLLKSGANLHQETTCQSVLFSAVKSRNLDKIQAILDAGVDIKYTNRRDEDAILSIFNLGYNVVKTDKYLCVLLEFLINKGASVHGKPKYGETALIKASTYERFDLVKILLDAGANPEPLQWNELMFAVLYGTIEDVKTLVDNGFEQFHKDHYKRTASCLAFWSNNQEKGRLLQNYSDDPVTKAIIENDLEAIKMYIANGLNVNEKNNWGNLPLVTATQEGTIECMKLLLQAGANPSLKEDYNNATEAAEDFERVKILLDAGGNPQDIDNYLLIHYRKLQPNEFGLHSISQEEFETGRARRFGTNNPEIMDIPFYKAMIYEGVHAYMGEVNFKKPENKKGVTWCYQRFGRTITELPDGRIIEISGEHEDYYDDDFCIFNDVVVFNPDGTFQIYGYPKEVFPCTDFHTATLVGNHIYIIGNVGYIPERVPEVTPVYRLNCDNFKIEKVETTGGNPGWIGNHTAIYQEPHYILISNGMICDKNDYHRTHSSFIDNKDTYCLNLNTLVWGKLTEH